MNTLNPLIAFHHVSTRMRDRRILQGTSWTLEVGESWAVIGPNGSGKTSFTRLLTGELPVVAGTMKVRNGFDPARDISVVSFETQKRLYAAESRKEDARQYSGQVLAFTPVREFLEAEARDNPLAVSSDIEKIAAVTSVSHLLDRNITKLSTGEFRKVLVARALLSSPRLLILDEPMEGLDAPSRERLGAFVDQLIAEGVQVIFVTHHLTSIPSAIGNVICLSDSRVAAQGKRGDLLDPLFIRTLYGPSGHGVKEALSLLYSADRLTEGPAMIIMKNVTVRYGGLTVLDGLSWTVERGEKWLVKGPNGSGKSTLLSLVAGDNPQAYANEIFLFGRRRGSGESIWDIKQRIGLVSSEFQLRYQKDMTIFHVVLSGFFDSVGLYRNPLPGHREKARAWLAVIGFEARAETLFTHLSFGEQKLVLIVRALVKSPEMLILDEPCQGLDPVNRKKILDLMETLGEIPETTLIYVTHHNDEVPACFDRVLCL